MKKSKERPKMYRVTKYIKATSAIQAIKFDKDTPVHEIWFDNDCKQDHLASAIGFDNGIDQEELE